MALPHAERMQEGVRGKDGIRAFRATDVVNAYVISACGNCGEMKSGERWKKEAQSGFNVLPTAAVPILR